MSSRTFYSAALATWIGLVWVGASRWRVAEPARVDAAARIVAAGPAPDDPPDGVIDAAEDLIVTNDPFRLANAPASVRYEPDDEGASGTGVMSASPPPVRPNMILKAIVGGPPWLAVIDGLPGQPPNTVVRSGSAYDKLIARAVTRDSVVIQGPDTTWVLSFRRPE